MRPPHLVRKCLRVIAEGVLWRGFVKLRFDAHSRPTSQEHFS